MHLKQGQIIDGYKLYSEIGSGAKGVVWLAQRVDHGEPAVAAIKFLNDRLVRDKREAGRFRQEARALLKVRHPGIARVYGLGVFEEVPYIVMEYVGGVTLKDYIRRAGYIPVDEALAFAAQIADALDHCHSLGVVHRDVKSLNIRISPAADGGKKAVLLDFGIAKMEDLSLSISGTIMGTPHYMSPQQARGEKLDCRTDQYSLAVVLWEMLSGQLLFTAPTMVEVCRKHIIEPPGALRIPGLSTLDPIYQRIDAALRQALAKDPGARFRNCFHFVQAVVGREPIGTETNHIGDAADGRDGADSQDGLLQQAKKPVVDPVKHHGGPGPSPISCLNVLSQLLLTVLVIAAILTRLNW